MCDFVCGTMLHAKSSLHCFFYTISGDFSNILVVVWKCMSIGNTFLKNLFWPNQDTFKEHFYHKFDMEIEKNAISYLTCLLLCSKIGTI